MKHFSIFLLCILSSTFSISQDEICPGADLIISAQGMSFSPDATIVYVGWTVGWVNYGGTHDVNGVSSSVEAWANPNPEEFALAVMTVDSVPVCLGTHTFTIPGFYSYDCTTYGHAGAGMVANITVHLPGCMDVLACNYDAFADTDDGSCIYSPSEFVYEQSTLQGFYFAISAAL